MRASITTLLTFALAACGSDVVIRGQPKDDDPPTVPDTPDPPERPTDPPPDPPDPPPDPTSCRVAVTVEQVSGSLECGYGGVSNLSPGMLLAVEPSPATDGVRFVMQGCPAGEDCICAVTAACVGSDVALTYPNALPTHVQAWIQPDELVLGTPGPWECIDCGYGPPFFHAASKLVDASQSGTIGVAQGPVTNIESIGGATFTTHALDGAAYEIGGLAPVQILVGSATVEEGQTLALVMDDDLLKLSLRNLGSTWCTDGCGPSDPPVGGADWVVFGPVDTQAPAP